MSDLITLVGTIVDHEGATPLAGARITATPSQRVTQTSDGEEALSDASATTDETGAFSLALVYAEGLRYTIVYRSGGERLMRGVLDCDSYAAGATVDVADLPPIAGIPPSAVETLQAWFLAQLEALGGDASPEGIQDVVGAMIVAAGGTYDDEAGTITLPSSGGSGGGVEQVDGIVTLDETGEPVREFYCTDAATINGVEFPAGTITVWRRTPADVWGYIVVDSWVDVDVEVPLGTLEEEILALSPTGYWKLDETTGTTAVDSSGNGHDGAYSGTYTLAALNGHATFAGGYVDIPDSDAWSMGTTPFSVFALSQHVGAMATTPTIVSKGASGNYEWTLATRSSDRAIDAMTFREGGTGTYILERTPSGAYATAQWNATAWTSPTLTTESRFQVYNNSGIPIPTTLIEAATTYANGTSAVRIAGRVTGSGVLFAGGIGHVAIFRSQLTEEQVARLMDAAAAEGYLP